jgi:hypothetical protein
MQVLGGLRHTRQESPNKSWINASFRGFADYMQTPEFAKALKALEKRAKKMRCALTRSNMMLFSAFGTTPFLRKKGKKLIYDGAL